MNSADEMLVGFTRALRSAGLTITPDRMESYLAAVAHLGLDRDGTRRAGRATLCSSPAEQRLHDLAFDAWFGRVGSPLAPYDAGMATISPGIGLDSADGASSDGSEADDVPALASRVETLRHRDFASLSAAERRLLHDLFLRLEPAPALRRTPRRIGHRRGEVDARQTIRASLLAFGEPTRVRYRKRTTRPRRIVLLMDISGSMTPYADAVLRLAHRFSQALPGLVDSYTLGTRVTRVTAALRPREADRALAEVGAMAPDWSGGTRLGSGLREFLETWGRPGAARGAVVVVFSDGWERSDTTELAEQVRRLKRLAHAVIWVNPHRGKEGYLPIQQGIVAVLPHVDALVAGHSLASFAQLLERVARS